MPYCSHYLRTNGHDIDVGTTYIGIGTEIETEIIMGTGLVGDRRGHLGQPQMGKTLCFFYNKSPTKTDEIKLVSPFIIENKCNICEYL